MLSYSMLFCFVCVQMESLLRAALCSLEVSNRTTPVDSKYVTHFLSSLSPFLFYLLSSLNLVSVIQNKS